MYTLIGMNVGVLNITSIYTYDSMEYEIIIRFEAKCGNGQNVI